jgi:ArsR family transcriptional regulator, cadmium/lead-responsive transcriptional repressor
MTASVEDRLWAAIADPSRRRVLNLLVDQGGISASWMADRVPFSRQAVSKHLATLELAGLVSRHKQGREVLYRVDAARLDQAVRAMADQVARWDRRLAAIKRLAEAAHAEAKGKRGS